MLQAVKAVVKQGQVVLLEDYPLKEGAEYLLVDLASQPDNPDEALRQRREAAVRWYDDHLAQVAASAPTAAPLTEAEIVQLVHESR